MLPAATETLKSCLNEINPYFQEKLESNFEDENRRRCNRPNSFNEISNAFSVNGNKVTLLKDLTIMHPPNFQKRAFDVRMEQLHINIALELEKLMIEGKYEVFNEDIGEGTPGNIIFILEGITIEGLIPIHVEEDSFVVNEDFVLSFNPTQITTKKSWIVNGITQTSECVETDKDRTLVKSFWSGLLDTIFYILYRDIGGPIVEYSVTELFADEPEEMIALSKQRVELAKKLASGILEVAKVLPGKNIVQVPDFNLTFKTENASTPSCISFKNGKLSNVLNTRKHGEFDIYQESDKVLYLSGGFEIRETTLSYEDCTAKHNNVESKGTSTLSMYRTKMGFKASVRKVGESYSTKLEDVQFSWVRDIDYDATGLECLSNIKDDIQLYLLSYFQGVLAVNLTEHLKEVFGEVLKKYDMVKIILEQ